MTFERKSDGSAVSPEATTLSDEELEFFVVVFDMAREGSSEALEEVLDAGVPVNLTNSSGDSLLLLASYYKQLETVELLLRRRADVERVNDRGQTALGAAVFRHDQAIVAALLEAGADPDAGAQSARSVAQFFGLSEMELMLAPENGASFGAALSNSRQSKVN